MGGCSSLSRVVARTSDKLFLQRATLDTVPVFTLKSQGGWGKIVSLYDGDTGKIVVVSPIRTTFPFRLVGIDCEEMRQPKSAEQRDEKKKFAISARNQLCNLSTSINVDDSFSEKGKVWAEMISQNKKLIWWKCDGWDKYGRALMHLWDNEPKQGCASINEQMITTGYGVAYDGGTKSQVIDTRVVA